MKARIAPFMLSALAVVFSCIPLSVAISCPFCSAPSLTLAEQMSQSDAVVLVEWVGGRKPTDEKAGQTTYRIKDIAQNSPKPVKVGDEISISRFRSADPGDLFVLMGTQGISMDWGSPLEVTESGYQYMTQSPSPEFSTEKRLRYFVKFLEFSDEIIADDAYAEFANAPYDDITKLSKDLPKEKIRQWIQDKDTPVTRLGLYGLLLGLCGDEEDAKLMKARIIEPSDDFRLGIDGIMSGYLLLTGAEGLSVLDETKLRATTYKTKSGEEKSLPFSETYSAMQALRFMWTYAGERIEKKRLRKSMRILLERPELADLVIADLSRWKDWEIQDRLMKMYDEEEYDIPSIKRAIVRFMFQCAKQTASKEDKTPTKAAVKAKSNLQTLEKKDPKTVAAAKRFMLP